MPKCSRVVVTILILLLIGVGTVKAQNTEEEKVLSFDHIGRDEGLKDVSISSMVQDRDGFIWLGTQGGLFKYNGRDMVGYRTNPFQEDGIVHNLIQTMFYDEEEHVLWIGTYQGISRLEISTNQFTNYTVEENGLSNSVVIAINKDRNGTMWFGTMNGLNRLEEASKSFEVIEVDEEVVRSLCLDSMGRLLVGTYNGLYLLEEDASGLERVDIEYPSLYVMDVKEFKEGTITIGMWDGGVLELDMNFGITGKHNYEDNRVYALHYSNDNTLWVGTWGGGLFVDVNNKVTHYEDSGHDNDVGHSIIYSILEDRDGTIWIGTNGGGIYRTNTYQSNNLILSNNPVDERTLDAGKINAIYEDYKGRLWVAVYNNGVNIYDTERRTLVKYNADNGLINDQIQEMIVYEDRLLLASAIGIIAYNEEGETFKHLGLLPNETNVYAFEIDQDNHLWVGTYLEGVYVFDEDFAQLAHYDIDSEHALSDNLVYDLLNDSKGRMWVCTNNGLDVFDSFTGDKLNSFRKDGQTNALPNNVIRTICETDEGVIWVGLTGGGVSKYNETTSEFVSYTEEEGLADNTVIGLVESYDHRLWAATHNGISIIDPVSDQIINLSIADGIGGYNFTSSGFVSSDDVVYFGGTFGVSAFPPIESEGADKIPPLYITKMHVMNKSVDESINIFNGREFEFDASEGFISFEFNVLDYLTTNQVRYSYQLLGVDEQVIESGNRNYASYSNLKPGNYEFIVRAKTIHGDYTDSAIVSFTIKRPWYFSVYAIIAYIIILGFLVYSLFKIRESKVLAKVSTIDPLTGVYNRRYFDTMLEDYIQLAKRSNSYLSLIMVDIDNFKSINDEFGHRVGDEYLKALANRITDSLPRKTDFCARYGGDEFMIVLYDTNEDGAVNVVNKIMDQMKVMNINVGTKQIEVETSVSAGVYVREPDDDNEAALLVDKADKAMYSAKTSGKNKSVMYRDI